MRRFLLGVFISLLIIPTAYPDGSYYNGGAYGLPYLKGYMTNHFLIYPTETRVPNFSNGLSAGTLSLSSGSITDSSGAISFGDENLTTTGTLEAGAITGTTGTFSAGLTADMSLSVLPKSSRENLVYKESKAISGLTLSYSGAADNYSVAIGKGIVNGKYWENPLAASGVRAATLLAVSGWTIKDVYIYQDGVTYYAFYSFWQNGVSPNTSDIAYATSSNLMTWTHQGVVVDNAICWGASTGGAWSPSVIKVGSTYYMYICGLVDGTQKMGYLTSTSLTSGWTWNDYMKDNAGNNILYDAAEIVYFDSQYYMVCGNARLYKDDALTSNSWTFVGSLLTGRGWEIEGSVHIEAPYLVMGTPFLLFYVGTDAWDNQRIGLAISDKIDGPYRRVGVDGMIYLDFPLGSKGPIVQPSVFYDTLKGLWYLFCTVGTETSGEDAQELMGYHSHDIINWQAISTSTQLLPSVTNYVYVNGVGQIIHSADLPYHVDRTSIQERVGYLRLGSLTVDASRQVTASSNYAGKWVSKDVIEISSAIQNVPTGQSDLRVINSYNDYAGINIKSSAAGGREYVLLSTADECGLGGGIFAIYDATGATVPLRISNTGNVTLAGAITLGGNLQFADNYHITHSNGPTNVFRIQSNYVIDYLPLLIGAEAWNNSIFNASNGTGSTTMYIGNATINVTASDERMKENVEPTKVDALKLIGQMDVVDFDWHKDNPWSERGRWTGLIAQDVYKYLPQVVNKPDDPENTWAVEYHHIVPYLIKAVQAQQKEIDSLKLRLDNAGIK